MPKNLTEIKVQEILAFTLYCGSMESAMPAADWRGDANLRDKWRALADSLMTELESMGVKVASRSAETIDKTIVTLATEPATKVYSLEDEMGQQTYGAILEDPAT